MDLLTAPFSAPLSPDISHILPGRAVAPVRMKSDSTGRLVLGVVSQATNCDPADFADFLVELVRAECTALVFLGPLPPYPKVSGIATLTVARDFEIDLVNSRTGENSKLFAIYDPALKFGLVRRNYARIVAAPYLADNTPPILLVGGTRVGGRRTPGVAVFTGGCYVVQVGVFSPCSGAEDVYDHSYGGTILRIDLNHPDDLVEPTFRAYGGF
jgi:hypothetical protein